MEKFFNHIQLGYLGLIPFLGCVGWPLMFGSNSLNLEFFTFYSIAILSFMPVEWALAWLGASFWLVLIFEKATPQWQTYHKDYQKMRVVLTSVVFVCHILTIGMSIYPK